MQIFQDLNEIKSAITFDMLTSEDGVYFSLLYRELESKFNDSSLRYCDRTFVTHIPAIGVYGDEFSEFLKEHDLSITREKWVYVITFGLGRAKDELVDFLGKLSGE